MLSNAGDHDPDIGVVFVELEGKVNAAPEHIAGTCVNVDEFGLASRGA